MPGMYTSLSGVYAAAVTPCNPAGEFDPAGLQLLLDFLARRGCHGSLLLGTTGEGPSFSASERLAIWQAAADWRKSHPDFRLLAGTGTPSLRETIEFTQAAFALGFEAVVVLPPYFIRNASEEGLFDWYAALIQQAVPDGRTLLGYHIPAVSGVVLPLSLLQRLSEVFGDKFGGLKDSSGSLESAQSYITGLPGKAVFVGSDKLLRAGLAAGAAGCITALANLNSAEARAIYDAHLAGEETAAMQAALDQRRAALETAPPAPAYLKAMLHSQHGLPSWRVKPPLRDFTPAQVAAAAQTLNELQS